MSKKTTKRALAMSFVSVFLCVCMLVGSTFAWFTDSATTSGNKIQAGTLDVKMSYLAPQTDSSSGRVWENFSNYYQNPDDDQWVDVESANAQPVFNYKKWEPGYTDCAYIMIENEGNLNLQYCLTVVPTGEVGKLAEVIDVYYQVYYQATTKDKFGFYNKGDWLNANHQKATPDNIWYDNMTAGSKYAGTLQDVIDGKFTLANDQMLYPNEFTGTMFNNIPQGRVYYAIALHMSEDAGNEYQNQSIGDAFDVRLIATQAIGETDMYSNDYDAKAEYPEIIAAEDLATVLTPVNGVITIDNDYIVTGEWTSINVEGQNITIDGKGHTISGLDKPLVAGNVGESLTIKNLTIANSDIGPAANENGLGTGAFACFKDAYGSATFENCHLVNSTVTSNYRAGGLIGYISGGELVITDCSVVNCEITGVEGAAGLVAHTQVNATITNSKVESTKITATEDRLGTKAPVAGAIVGTANGDAVVTFTGVESVGNTVSNNNATAVHSEKIGRLVGNATVIEN